MQREAQSVVCRTASGGANFIRSTDIILYFGSLHLAIGGCVFVVVLDPQVFVAQPWPVQDAGAQMETVYLISFSRYPVELRCVLQNGPLVVRTAGTPDAQR